VAAQQVGFRSWSFDKAFPKLSKDVRPLMAFLRKASRV
jgi:hypothetical protein